MITLSFPCPVERLRVLQEVVKATDGRFVRHSRDFIYDSLPTSHVTIEFQDSTGYALFSQGWQRINTRFTELKTSRWRKLVRKIKGRLFK